MVLKAYHKIYFKTDYLYICIISDQLVWRKNVFDPDHLGKGVKNVAETIFLNF